LLIRCVISTLQLTEVVVEPVESLVPEGLVLRDPVTERSQARRVEAIETTSPDSTAPDETHVTEDPEMLGDLRLGDRELVDDRSDRLLSFDQGVEDLAAMRLGDRIEDVGRGRSPGHNLIICLYRHI
jgi:hypothetical protein